MARRRKRPPAQGDQRQGAKKFKRSPSIDDELVDHGLYDAHTKAIIDLTASDDGDEPMNDAHPKVIVDLNASDDGDEPMDNASSSSISKDVPRIRVHSAGEYEKLPYRRDLAKYSRIEYGGARTRNINFSQNDRLRVEATARKEAQVPLECTPASISFEGNLQRIYLKGERKAVAVVVSTELPRLVNEYAVTLTATICGKKSQYLGTVRNMSFAKSCYIRIVVYGFLEQGHAVATTLANGDLFLQHPGESEFDRSVKYFNPQYLLAPRQEMPPLEKLSIYICCSSRGSEDASAPALLRGDERNQILKIFDTTYMPHGTLTMVEPSPRLVAKLKRHQIEALTMMVEKEAGIHEYAQFPTIWKHFESPSGQARYQNVVTKKFERARPPSIGGGILADEMGLGKTLSSISLICHGLDILDSKPEMGKISSRATLIVTPKSTIPGWENQIERHVKPGKLRWLTYHGPKRNQLGDLSSYDVVLTTYSTVMFDRTNNGPLFDRDWARIMLDEAHRIRNQDTQTFIDVSSLRASYRWCLTGTPIQNRLDDYGALLTFVRVPPFLLEEEFEKYLKKPIAENKKDGLQLLKEVVAATCLRRTKSDPALALNLPKKKERIEIIEMPREDRELYEFFKHFCYLTAASKKKGARKAGASNILGLLSTLRLICDHGVALIPNASLQSWRDRDLDLLTLEMLETGAGRCVSCNDEIDKLETAVPTVKELHCGHVLCERCTETSQYSASQSPSAPGEFNPTPLPRGQLISPLTRQHPPSAKVKALLRNVAKGEARGRVGTMPSKCVIFSCWTKMLDLIGFALRDEGMEFRRIDGSSSLSDRRSALKEFNDNGECNIMLASLEAAGEGIDLTAANSVHIVEPSWNPMAEAQAVDRIHRMGQQRDVEVIRYIYVQDVQNDKLRLIKQTLSSSEEDTEDIVDERFTVSLSMAFCKSYERTPH
ncbi:hypothetical protein GQ53DRAFT_784087 [Thozetella sp. PMI_491]|nr:hypothetical protein GQ53DRAFT_784087 [Thozetella sp. PMI_491]